MGVCISPCSVILFFLISFIKIFQMLHIPHITMKSQRQTHSHLILGFQTSCLPRHFLYQLCLYAVRAPWTSSLACLLLPGMDVCVCEGQSSLEPYSQFTVYDVLWGEGVAVSTHQGLRSFTTFPNFLWLVWGHIIELWPIKC